MRMVSVFEDDWSAYYDIKKVVGSDPAHFVSSEKWEVDYLSMMICKHYPFLNAGEVRNVIINCCKEKNRELTKDVVLKQVMNYLNLK